MYRCCPWWLFCLLALLAPLAYSDEFLDPKVAFQPTARALDGRTIEIHFAIARNYYLYRDKFRFAADPAAAELGTPSLPPGTAKDDETFGRVEVYYNAVTLRVPVVRNSSGELPVTLKITSQGCAEAGLCYPPQQQQVHLELPNPDTPAATDATLGAALGSDSGRIAELFRSSSFWLLGASFFGFGLLLSLTPCVFPMIPILSSIIVGSERKGHGVSHMRGFSLSLAYVLGMAITYAAAGVAAGLTGTLLAATLQNPWVLASFALVFVLLALSMFGFYELQLPPFLQSKVSDEARRLKGGSLPAVLFMGALSALIVGPCVAAPLAGALIYIGQTRDAVLGGAALFAMALGMGTPLLVVGISAGAVLPKSGPWMDAVKKTFGVILLGTAVWLVSPVLPAAALMIAWALLLIVPAIYLHALDPLPPHARGWQRFWKGIGIVLLLFGASLLVGTLAGSRDPLQPLSVLRSSDATGSDARPLPFVQVRSLPELTARLEATKQPVLLEFFADWCVSCKEMERFTFSDQRVRNGLAGWLLLRADVTANSEHDKAMLQRFGLFGPPAIVFFDQTGKELAAFRVIGFQNAEEFGGVLTRANQNAWLARKS